MTSDDGRSASYRSAADHLEKWADSLPRWSQDGQEPWYVFVDRRYDAETALVERLRRAPSCRIKTCPARMHVDLTLGSITVSTDQGLPAAMRKWANRARARLDG